MAPELVAEEKDRGVGSAGSAETDQLLGLAWSDDRFRSMEESLLQQAQQRRYDVSTWIEYCDAVEERIDDAMAADQKHKQMTQKSKQPSGGDSNSTRHLPKLRKLREFVGRRALRNLPRSYKLWKRQWEFLMEWEKKLLANETAISEDDDVDDADDAEEEVEYVKRAIRGALERCLWTLHAMPKPWIVYLEWVMRTSSASMKTKGHPVIMDATEIRRLVDRALRSVPATQHVKLWPVIRKLCEVKDGEDDGENGGSHPQQHLLPPESRLRIMERYCSVEPSYRRVHAQELARYHQWGKAALAYRRILTTSPTAGDGAEDDDEGRGGDSAGAGGDPAGDGDAWSSFVAVCSQHPVEAELAGVPWEAMVRTVLEGIGNAGGVDGSSASDDAVNSPDPHVAAAAKAAAASASANKQQSQSLLHGFLWSQLADSYIRRGHFDLARSVYEEGMLKVSTVRDFTVLFQAYLNLEEGLLQVAAERAELAGKEEEEGEEGGDAADDGDDWDLLLSSTTTAGGGGGPSSSSSSESEKARGGASRPPRPSELLAEMEWSLARAEHLTERRPFLVNAVLLRQNPHNVGEWLNRCDLFSSKGKAEGAGAGGAGAGGGAMKQAAQVLEQALKTVHSNRAINGKFSEIVCRLVKVYEEDGALGRARDLLDRVCRQGSYRFSSADQLADCWVAWIELELRHERWDDALSLARQAVAPQRPIATAGRYRTPNLTRSLRLWDLLLDLEESLGTVQTTKDAYNVALETQVATVQHVLNFAQFLTEHKYFEEAFTAYERGAALFPFPHEGAKLLWKEYLQAFLKRYKGTKVERARDLFERCQEHCPADVSAEFYIMNGSFEEEYGLSKRALSVYKSMCAKVPKEEKLTAYKLWIAKTTKYHGLTATRDIYQEALEKLDDPSAATLCLDFMKMETSLQQIDRARAILTYGAQMADPRRLPEYWKAWNEFEIAHGNEETFREMLRVKRSVEAAFSSVNYNASGMTDKVDKMSEEEAMRMIASQEGMELTAEQKRAKASAIAGFVPSTKRPAEVANLDDMEERVAKLRKATAGAAAAGAAAEPANRGDGDEDDEEIDIDDIDAEIEAAAAEGAAEDPEEKEAPPPPPPATAPKASGLKDVSTKAVPAAVFGGLAKEAQQQQQKAS